MEMLRYLLFKNPCAVFLWSFIWALQTCNLSVCSQSWIHISKELKEAFQPDYTEPSCDVCEVSPSYDTIPKPEACSEHKTSPEPEACPEPEICPEPEACPKPEACPVPQTDCSDKENTEEPQSS